MIEDDRIEVGRETFDILKNTIDFFQLIWGGDCSDERCAVGEVTEGKPNSIAFVMPLRRANDSAIRGEPTFSMIRAPDERDPVSSLVKSQTIPARFDEASQTASTKQQSVRLGESGDMSMGRSDR